MLPLCAHRRPTAPTATAGRVPATAARAAATVPPLLAATALAAIWVLAGCARTTAPGGGTAPGVVAVVAAENQYGDVASQIGGPYVHVVSVVSNPNTDPHTYEVSPAVAEDVAKAGLVIRNGLGYDTFINRVESASPSSHRRTVDVQQLLGLPDSTPNPHLWYDPRTMPAVAKAIAGDLGALDPAHASQFQANLVRFDAALQPWLQAIATFKAGYGGTPAATSEPVANYLLEAMGIENLAPPSFQAAVMNGTDPTPQDIAMEEGLLSARKVKFFAYNAQVVDSLTQSIRSRAQAAGVPVVSVYETMPTPGYDYQSWMLAETNAIKSAVADGTSTTRL